MSNLSKIISQWNFVIVEMHCGIFQSVFQDWNIPQWYFFLPSVLSFVIVSMKFTLASTGVNSVSDTDWLWTWNWPLMCLKVVLDSFVCVYVICLFSFPFQSLSKELYALLWFFNFLNHLSSYSHRNIKLLGDLLTAIKMLCWDFLCPSTQSRDCCHI